MTLFDLLLNAEANKTYTITEPFGDTNIENETPENIVKHTEWETIKSFDVIGTKEESNTTYVFIAK